MFKNMSRSEKMLAGGVGSVIFLFLLLIAFDQFKKRYDTGKTAIEGNQNLISDEKKLQLDGVAARMRKKFLYLPSSFPSGGQVNITRYQNWLVRLQRECGFKNPNLSKPDDELLKYTVDGYRDSNFVAGTVYTYRFDTVITLDQALEFCHKFESADFLHKIKLFTITPLRNKEELTGKCKASYVIEVLAMSEADETLVDFDSRKKKLPKSIEDYENIVVSRNIFGPANNAPTLRVSKRTFDNDEKISYSLSGRDEDKDKLIYEMVENGGIEGATLEQKEGSSRATFKCDELSNGDYAVVFRVTDDGFPAKSAEVTWNFTVKDPKPKIANKETKEPDPPPFVHATETKITRISSRNGVGRVGIKVLTTGEKFDLRVRDETSQEKPNGQFELDGETWTIREITPKTVKIETAGKLLEYQKGGVLNAPLKTTVLDDAKEVDKEESMEEVSTGK